MTFEQLSILYTYSSYNVKLLNIVTNAIDTNTLSPSEINDLQLLTSQLPDGIIDTETFIIIKGVYQIIASYLAACSNNGIENSSSIITLDVILYIIFIINIFFIEIYTNIANDNSITLSIEQVNFILNANEISIDWSPLLYSSNQSNYQSNYKSFSYDDKKGYIYKLSQTPINEWKKINI